MGEMEDEDEWKEKLTSKLVYLMTNVNCSSLLLAHLRQGKVLSGWDVDEIKSQRTPQDKNDCLITFILKRPKDDYYRFLEALIETEQQHIANRIEGTDVVEWPRYQKYRKLCSDSHANARSMGTALIPRSAAQDNIDILSVSSVLNINATDLQYIIGDYAMAKLNAAHLHLINAVIILYKTLRDHAIWHRRIQNPPSINDDRNLVMFRENLRALGMINDPNLLPEGFTLEIRFAYQDSCEAVNLCHSELSAHLHALKIVLFCLVHVHSNYWPKMWLPYLRKFLGRKDVQRTWQNISTETTSACATMVPSHSQQRWQRTLHSDVGDDDERRQTTNHQLLEFFSSIRGVLRRVGVTLPSIAETPNNVEASEAELFDAITQRNQERVRILLAMDSDANAEDEIGRTPLAYAIERAASIEMLQELINYDADINKEAYNGPPLHWAVRYNNIDAAKLLLLRGAMVDYMYGGECAIHIAAWNGTVEIIKVLAEYGCDIDITNFGAMTPLQLAIDNLREGAVDKILECGGNPNKCSMSHQAPFILATSYRHIGIINRLVECHSFDPNRKLDRGRCLLHFALVTCDVEVIAKLIRKGANVTTPNIFGNTPLHDAAGMGREEALMMMLQGVPQGDKLALVNNKGDTMLHLAAGCKRGNTIIIDLLIDKGLKLDTKNHQGITPLHVAASYGHTDTLASCFGHVSIAEALRLRDNEQHTLLHSAAMSNKKENAKFLIRKGFDVNSRSYHNKTPLDMIHRWVVAKELITACNTLQAVEWKGRSVLHYACEGLWYNIDDRDDLRIIKHFTRMGYRTNSGNNKGLTSLHYAMIYCPRISIIKQLIAFGVDVKATDSKGNTALHHLCSSTIFDDGRSCDPEIVKLMIKNGADVNAESVNGSTPLSIAAVKKNEEMMETLIETGANIHAVDKNGDNALHHLCSRHNSDVIPVLQSLIDKGISLNGQNKKGCTPLHKAAGRSSAYVIKVLVDNGADVKATDSKGNTALHHLCSSTIFDDGRSCDPVIVKLMIKNGADVNAESANGSTPLSIAVAKMNKKMMKTLIENGANIHAVEKNGENVIHHLCNGTIFYDDRSWDPEIVKLMIKNGADVNAESANGSTPLSIAAAKMNKKMMKTLFENGANIHAVEKNGENAVHRLCSHYNTSVNPAQQLLIDKGISLNEQNKKDSTPLHKAAESSSTYVIEVLVDNCADLHAVDIMGNTALHYAVANDLLDANTISMFIGKGAAVNSRNMSNCTPLHIAAKRKPCNVMVVHWLIMHGADLCAADIDGNTALHIALSNNFVLDVFTIALLSSKGTAVNSRNRSNRTPLHIAAERCNDEVVRLLITRGADLCAADTDGNTALHCALSNNLLDVDTITLLIRNGAAVSSRNRTGCTPLHIAAEYSSSELVISLIIQSADLCAQDSDGNTILHYARLYRLANARDIVDMVISNGVGVNSRNRSNRTPLHKAAEYGDKYTVFLLAAFGADSFAVDVDGNTALHYAALNHKGDADRIVKLLINEGLNVNSRNKFNRTPLHNATKNSNERAVKALFFHGAALEVIDNEGHNALHYATKDDIIELFTQLNI